MQQGLAALRVVDFSTGIPGAYCCRLLADAGADVVKVEPPDGDPWRAWSAGGAARRLRRRAARCSGSSTTACARSSAAPTHRSRRAARDAPTSCIDEHRPSRVRRATGCHDEHPGLVVCSITPYGTHRAVRGPADQRVHRAGRVGRPGRARVGHAGVRSRRAAARASGWRARSASVAVAAAALRAQRTGHGEHIDFSICEVMTIAANSYAEYMRALRRQPADRRRHPHDRDAVGRADPRRLRRLLHQQPRAVRQLPAAHRAPRPRRRRLRRAAVGPPEPLGRVERHRPRVDAATHHRRDRAAGERAAHPGRAGAQRREHLRLRPLRRPRRLRRRPDRHSFKMPAPPVAHGRRGPAAAASVAAARRAHGDDRAARTVAAGRRRRCPAVAAGGCARARPHRVVGGPDRRRRASPRSAPT